MSDEKLAVFAPQTTQRVGHIELRPVTAETFVILQLAKSPFASTVSGPISDVFFQIMSFVFIQGADKSLVRKAINTDGYRDAVLDFCAECSGAELLGAAPLVKTMIEKALIGLDYELEPQEGESAPSPN